MKIIYLWHAEPDIHLCSLGRWVLSGVLAKRSHVWSHLLHSKGGSSRGRHYYTDCINEGVLGSLKLLSPCHWDSKWSSQGLTCSFLNVYYPIAVLEPVQQAFSPVNFHQFKRFRIINANILYCHFRKDKFNAIGILQSCFLIKH